jgi:phage replication O-like protein O
MNETPQLEDGYIRIAIELVDRFTKLHLSGNEWQILWAIMRKTWGWHKKSDVVPLSQLEQLTDLRRPRVCEALDGLVRKNVLVVRKSVLGNDYAVNKLHTQWVVRKSVPSTEKRTIIVRKSVHSKDTTKDIRTSPQKIPKKIPKPQASKSILESSELLVELKTQFPAENVQGHLDEMKDWLLSTGRVYKDYKAFARNWIRKSKTFGKPYKKEVKLSPIQRDAQRLLGWDPANLK